MDDKRKRKFLSEKFFKLIIRLHEDIVYNRREKKNYTLTKLKACVVLLVILSKMTLFFFEKRKGCKLILGINFTAADTTKCR